MKVSREQLLEQFSEFLQQHETDAGTHEADQQPPDLYGLFTELGALKAEVKKEARQHKEAMGHFKSLLGLLETSNNQLVSELSQKQQAQQQAVLQAQSTLLSEIIDLHDRLESTITGVNAFQSPRFERKASREFRVGLLEGLEITQRRVNYLLKSHDITILNAIGKAVDPHLMRVTEVRCDPDQADGIVLEELRRGYLHQGELFRLAEVVANRHERQSR